MSEKYSVPAIDNAIKILNFLGGLEQGEASLTEICTSIQLNRSSCYRILYSLQRYDIVSFNPLNKKYKLGHYLMYLGSKASFSLNNWGNFQRYLEEATEVTQQTCILSQRYGRDQVVYVAKQESPLSYRINVNTGQLRPLTSTSTGKCFLTFMDSKEVQNIIKDKNLEKFTPYTILNEEKLLNELNKMEKMGYVISKEEYLLGVSGVAAPIFDENLNVKFVLSASCLSAQVSDNQLHNMGRELKKIADQITEEMFNLNQNNGGDPV